MVDPLTAIKDRRTTTKVATLPPDESWAFWDFVPLPTLIFDIINTVYCNATPAFVLTTNYDKSGGSSVLRKHRVTRAYHNTYPNPDLSASSFQTANLQYDGKLINISVSNVLNDEISYTSDFYITDGSCFWTEAYDFPATNPTATEFLAGDWFTREFRVKEWGESGWISELVEYYSAEGNPSI